MFMKIGIIPQNVSDKDVIIIVTLETRGFLNRENR